ncbi:MAG: NADH:quinone oxidoreductase subunit N [Candidatus Westeberhardia cardiocondylae]|nr:NADH:quinone oxidoreductase subunit N [Candidatus Westeberhardia cardiocondylae]
MIKLSQELIALLPIFIIGFTILIILLNIIWTKNHTISMYITNIGLNLALYFIKYQNNKIPIYITPLISIDTFSIFYTNLILLGNLINSVLSYTWLKSVPNNQKNEFYLFILIASIGNIILCSAEHCITMFVGIELISLSLFGIIGYNILYNKESLKIIINYIILSMISSSFFLFGIALIYAYIGELSFCKIKELLNNSIVYSNIILIALSMIIAGLGFKLSLVPFHLIIPKLYQTSHPQTIIFLLLNKTTVFLTTLRFLLQTSIAQNKNFCTLLIVLSSISIILGTCMALKQDNIKKLLSYSSISNFGYLTIGLTTIKQNYSLTMEAIGIYLTSYLLANIGILNIIDIITHIYSKKKLCTNKIKTNSLYFYKGLFWKHPYISLLLTIFLLSLAGIPMTLGFVGKIYIMTLGIHNKIYWLNIIIIIGNTISIIYYIYIITILFIPNSINNKTKFHLNQYYKNIIILTLFTLCIIILGIYPKPLITILKTIKTIEL